jgi:hypothetical protein
LVCAREAFELCVAAELESFSERLSGEHGHLFADHVAALRRLSVDSWLAALREIKLRGLKPKSRRVGSAEPAEGLIGYMLHNDWYGYPAQIPISHSGLPWRCAMRLTSWVYDVTDLVLSGDFDSAEDLVQYASSMVTAEFASTAKTVVLTEGRTDGRVLAESLQVLYPHLRDYFTFMDFDGAFTNMRMGVAAHLEGVMNGTFLVALGAIWTEVKRPPPAETAAYWTALYGTYANWLTTTLAGSVRSATFRPTTPVGAVRPAERTVWRST